MSLVDVRLANASCGSCAYFPWSPYWATPYGDQSPWRTGQREVPVTTLLWRQPLVLVGASHFAMPSPLRLDAESVVLGTVARTLSPVKAHTALNWSATGARRVQSSRLARKHASPCGSSPTEHPESDGLMRAERARTGRRPAPPVFTKTSYGRRCRRGHHGTDRTTHILPSSGK
jgi:hypothetical protein